MRFRRLPWPIVFLIAVIAPCTITGPATADFIAADIQDIPANVPAFIQEFRAFLADFSRWDTAHLELPLMALALTPEQQRPEMLLLLWDLWMHDHANSSTGSFIFPSMVSLAEASQPQVSGTPGTGGGTVASIPGLSNEDGPGGSSGSAPEPSSLVLIAYGSLGLIAYRLIRLRNAWSVGKHMETGASI